MDLTFICDETLLIDIKILVGKERNLTISVLHHLQEISRRKLFAFAGFSSLFSFCVHELGYSEAETALRISAMKLTNELKEVEKKIEEGKISLTQAAQVGTMLRNQPDDEKLNKEETLELIGKIEGKSTRETKIILEECSGKPVNTKINFSVSQDLFKMIQELKARMGKSSEEEVLKILCEEKLLKEKKKDEEAVRKEVVVNNPHGRYIPTVLKRKIDLRAGWQCEYRSPISGFRCTEKFSLEIHHAFAFALGGETKEENLLSYCKAHNARMAVEAFGVHKMDIFSKKLF
jgi:5-methylcytosine-specific restriction endonuclease McrA